MYTGLHVKCSLFLSDFNYTWIFLGNFSKNSQISNFMEIRPVGAELFHANEETDSHNEYSLFAILRTHLNTKNCERICVRACVRTCVIHGHGDNREMNTSRYFSFHAHYNVRRFNVQEPSICLCELHKTRWCHNLLLQFPFSEIVKLVSAALRPFRHKTIAVCSTESRRSE
jgi:hypothetical protein